MRRKSTSAERILPGQASAPTIGAKHTDRPGRLGCIGSLIREAGDDIGSIALAGGIVLLALFLRVYEIELVAWHPDSYERLADTERLLSGELPRSKIYGPGVSLIMAPAMAVFGSSLETMQGVLVAAGAGLAALAFLWMLRLSNDKWAAAVFALLVATSPAFVLASRVALYDILVAFLAAASMFVVPLIRHKPAVVLVGYGFTLALLVSIRPTNAVLLPALLVYWAAQPLDFKPAEALRELVSGPALIAFGSFLAFSVLLALGGGWSRSFSTSPFAFDRFMPNLSGYLTVLGGGLELRYLLAPLALVGAMRLARLDFPLLLAMLWISVAWPLAHAPFYFYGERYMLPAQVFVFLLVALGASAGLSALIGTRSRTLSQSSLARYFYVPVAVLGVAALAATTWSFADSLDEMMETWPAIATGSDEGQARTLRPVIANLDRNGLVVSAITRLFRDSNAGLEYLDLLDYTVDRKNNPEGRALLSARIDAALADGRPVFYVYSHIEEGYDLLGDAKERYHLYFESIGRDFELVELFRTAPIRSFVPWIVYRVQRRS